MAIQRIDVAHDLARFGKLLVIEHAAAHHEADCTARICCVAPNAPVHVFLAGNGGQHFTGHIVRHIAFEHLPADSFQLHMNFFQRIGAVFDIRIKQLQQQLFGVGDQTRHAARAHAR